jgi:hypothetical protein
LLVGERGAEWSDGVREPRSVERHDVEVPLDDQGLSALADALARLEEPEELLALLVDEALRAVDVLGWCLPVVRRHVSTSLRELLARRGAQGAPGEPDHPAHHVDDREHQPVPEPIVVTTLARDEESGALADEGTDTLSREVPSEPVPVCRCVPQAEVGEGRRPASCLVRRSRGERRAWHPSLLELRHGERSQHVA